MKRKGLYIFLVAALAVCFAACSSDEENGDRIPSLQESYAKNDKKPFGGYIAYQQLNTMFSQNTIKDKNQPFFKTWNSITDTSSLYVCFAPAVFVNEEEVKAMLDYVYAGNNLFIGANYIDEELLKKISCEEIAAGNSYFSLDTLRSTSTKSVDSAFSYFYKPFKNHLKFKDEEFTKVLGYNEDDKPNFILYYHGKGKLFLHCDPRAFSNYFLLKKENYKYMQDAFSYANNFPDHVYWDDYYRRLLSRRGSSDGREGSFSTFKVIMSHPPLAWAFWLFLLLLALYILFGGKRRQRIIEKIKPNVNTSVTFTETIGLLYLQQKDNKNIAEKMAAYFNEHVRNSYFLNTSVVNDDFITALSRKSGAERGKVEALYRAIQHAHNNTVVDDYQLLSLNQQIQDFYKKK